MFVAGTIPLTTTLALGLALLVRLPLKLRTLFRAGFFVPSVVSMVVISLIWKHLYAPFGGMNALLGLFGLPPQRWLLDPELALPAVMAMDVWASVGYYMVLYLAGLENIPGELYEAAAVDGATVLQRFRYVTLPGIRNIVMIVLLLSTIWTFNDFAIIYILTKGGPGGATQVLPVLTYEIAFGAQRLGEAIAVALYMLPALAFVIIVLSNYMRKGRVR